MVEWFCRTFGFAGRLRIGNHRAQLSFGKGSTVVTQRNSESSVPNVRVEDVNRHYEHVREAVDHIGGHRRTFSQMIAGIDPKTWGGILFED